MDVAKCMSTTYCFEIHDTRGFGKVQGTTISPTDWKLQIDCARFILAEKQIGDAQEKPFTLIKASSDIFQLHMTLIPISYYNSLRKEMTGKIFEKPYEPIQRCQSSREQLRLIFRTHSFICVRTHKRVEKVFRLHQFQLGENQTDPCKLIRLIQIRNER